MTARDGPSKPVDMTTATAELQSLQSLVTQAQRGDRRSADRLIREHEPWVRSVVFGVLGRVDLVDDVVQQVWTQAWERLGSLENPARLRSWLYTIARNAAIDAGIARKRRAATADVELLDAARDARRDVQPPNPARVSIEGELRATLLRAVEALPALYREPFVLRHLEGWSYAQIAELLGVVEETVETRLVRARRMLRELMRDRVD
ncbi:MAG: RNA polymerase sigma factor [Phycisphaerae bacterium]